MSDARGVTRRGFLGSAAAVGAGLAAGLSPEIAEPSGPAALPSGTPTASGAIRPFPLTQVRLLPGPWREAEERNGRYLLGIPPDRLLHTFRIQAGLPTSAEPLGGWEKPDCELRGHFTGHYLSACALMWASTGEDVFRTRATTMVAELARCQKASGNGYLSAFPEELFDRLRRGAKVWAPFYTLHKLLAGLLLVHELLGDEGALRAAEEMALWIRTWTKGLSDAQMERILTVEYGGMNEALYDLSAATGKEEWRDLAHRFAQDAFFAPLAARRDELKGLHVNTQIPKVLGAARRWELTGETRYRDVAEYFFREVTGARCYATGNTSNGERWETGPGELASQLSSSTAECCCAYNLLKLARRLFTWTGDPRLADYHERTLLNSRLGTQNPADGTLMYYLPLASGYWKYWGEPLGAFWCCTGTGVEEFAKLGGSIYFHDDEGIFVNLFAPSRLDWPEKGIRLRQETEFPREERTGIVFENDRPVRTTLRLRVPWWARRGGSVRLNGEVVPAFASPSSYLTLTREWKPGDRLTLEIPMSLAAEPMPDDGNVQAVLYGPLVLAGKLGTAGLTRAMRYGGYDCELTGSPVPVADVVADPKDVASWVEKIPGSPLSFRTRGQGAPVPLVPLNEIVDDRYAVYWKLREAPRSAG